MGVSGQQLRRRQGSSGRGRDVPPWGGRRNMQHCPGNPGQSDPGLSRITGVKNFGTLLGVPRSILLAVTPACMAGLQRLASHCSNPSGQPRLLGTLPRRRGLRRTLVECHEAPGYDGLGLSSYPRTAIRCASRPESGREMMQLFLNHRLIGPGSSHHEALRLPHSGCGPWGFGYVQHPFV